MNFFDFQWKSAFSSGKQISFTYFFWSKVQGFCQNISSGRIFSINSMWEAEAESCGKGKEQL